MSLVWVAEPLAMASIALDPDSGFYRIVFRYGGKQYRRSLKVREGRRADAIRGRVEETLYLLDAGHLAIPEGAEPGNFILTGGKVAEPSAKSLCGTVALSAGPATLGMLLAAYQRELPAGAKEPNSLRTERIHLGHVARLLGPDTALKAIDLAAAQRYAASRAKEVH